MDAKSDASDGLGGSLQGASAASWAEMSAAIIKGTCPVEELPGNGAFGRVYETSAVGGDGQVEAAVKVVHKLAEIGGGLQHGTGAKGVMGDANVAREIAILANLNGSPGVVELLSWSEGHFDAHLVFPAFQHSLLRYLTLQHKKALSAVGGKIEFLPPAAKRLLNGPCHVHSRKVIHGDLKPGNILVNEMSKASPAIGGINVVIADFESAASADVLPGSPECYTKLAGNCNTTYQYRAPELFVVKKFRAVSYATDIWAMGCVIAEMDTGSIAFGRSRSRNISELGVVFNSLLRILYRATDEKFTEMVKNDTALFFKELAKLHLQATSKLPWGKKRPLAFQRFMASFFVANPAKREAASTLLSDSALRDALRN